MGYQRTPTVYANARFVPSGSPLDVVVPTGATGLYVSWLFGNVLDRRPSNLFTSLLSNTVARFALGPDGENIGVSDINLGVSFENLGTPTRFDLTLDIGFDLNTGSQVITGTASVRDDSSNQSPFASLLLSLYNSRNVYSAIIGAGRTFFDAALRITHNAGSSRTIRVGDSFAAYRQVERLARDAT